MKNIKLKEKTENSVKCDSRQIFLNAWVWARKHLPKVYDNIYVGKGETLVWNYAEDKKGKNISYNKIYVPARKTLTSKHGKHNVSFVLEKTHSEISLGLFIGQKKNIQFRRKTWLLFELCLQNTSGLEQIYGATQQKWYKLTFCAWT